MEINTPKPIQILKNHHLVAITAFSVALLICAGGFLFWYRYNAQRIKKLEMNLTESESKNDELVKTYCKGKWGNGTCVNTKQVCTDTDVNEKPNDIYIKGEVKYVDSSGVEQTLTDECNGAKTQVNEMWCYENPAGSGNFVPGKMVYNCETGCLNGACILGDENTLKEALSQKYNKPLADVNMSIGKRTSTHVFGSVSFAGEPAGAWFLAVKMGNTWKIVDEGNGTISCSIIEPYDFPATIVPECWDESTNTLKVRDN